MIAPNGHWYTQAPQAMHLSLSIEAASVFSSREMALTLQAFSQGRLWLVIALYGQTLAQAPHSTHFSLSMTARWCLSKLMAPRLQTSSQRCAMQPRQDSVTV